MEAILGLVGIVIVIALAGFAWRLFWTAVGWLLGLLEALCRAAWSSLTSQSTFADSWNLYYRGMSAIEVRIVDDTVEVEGSSLSLKSVQVKGLIPLQQTTNVEFVTSVLDTTTEEYEPVLCVIDTFQEATSIAYQATTTCGSIKAGMGYPEWVQVAAIFPETLQPPYSGSRQLAAIVRLVDTDQPPDISLGFHDSPEQILWQTVTKFTYTFDEKGYKEASEHRDEANEICLKIGVAVAFSDGSFDESEGKTIQQWILKTVSPFSESKQHDLKQRYNSAFKDSYAKAKAGDLALSPLIYRMNEISDKSQKYEALELCFDIMAADGVADSEELQLIQRVASAFDLDLKEIERMRDQSLVSLEVDHSRDESIESVLGIDPSWPSDQINQHLRAEFQKWNNRLNTLPEGSERENAQRMLDSVAKARKKYAA